MCGIAGLLALSVAAQAPTRKELEAMIGTLQHRGPDGSTVHFDGPFGVAHARLSIIDLEGGWQPLFNETGDVAVVLNGEIFNHVELREELRQRGHRFRTASDTEVLVHLYEELGDEFVQRLNGQFAIALWDQRRGRLLLARDPAGIRPLFHTRAAGRLAFASEVKALFALPEVHRRIDATALASIFTYWSVLPPRSVFEGVSTLPPGHRLIVERDGELRQERWYQWQFPAAGSESRATPEDLAAELRVLMLDAVRLQLRSDVPVGAYLSGGLDSSIIAALVRREQPDRLRTFSLTFEDEEFDESRFQREMVAHLDAEHTSIRCRRSDIGAAFPRTIWHTESPVVRTAPTPLMLLSGHVHAAGYKVVLTGEGADEVFGGYDLFKEAKARRFMARAPGSTWRGRILERLYPYLRASPVASRGLAERFFREGLEQADRPWFAHMPRMTATRRVMNFLRPELRERLAGWDATAALQALVPPDLPGWSPLARDQWVEAQTLLSGYLLSSQGDRMSMAHSVEGRMPFLDPRVIDFANALPPAFKLHGLDEKWLLKRAFAADLPTAISRRSKQPYRAPDSASFFHAGRAEPWLDELLSEPRVTDAAIFDAAAVTRLVAKCRAGRAIGFGDNMAFVGVVSTMLLHEQFIRPQTPTPWT